LAQSFTLETEIASLGGRGDGIAETARGRLYVPYTVPGDRVGVRTGRAIGDGHEGELIELLKAGPNRVEPPCPHFHDCGGCALQHVSVDFYAEWKRNLVVVALERQGLDGRAVAPLVQIAQGDRRRADFVARRISGKILLGFNRRASHKIVDLQTCLVLDWRVVALLEPLRQLLPILLTPGTGCDVKATLTESGIDLLFEGAMALTLKQRELLARLADEQDLARVGLRNPTSGFSDVIIIRRVPIVRFGNVPIDLPFGAFLQASPAAEAALTSEVLSAVLGAKRVADLYAGCGTFSLPLSASAEILAIEGDETQVAALRMAANRARRPVRVERRDLSRRPLVGEELQRFDAVVFDPPRAGAKEQAATLGSSKVPTVVAVSCAPSTFARDARLLVEGGYRLQSVIPIDQFLWSTHVELVGVFRR
jgi:23S rRNA (uracil1939-C5)-methyltransferase